MIGSRIGLSINQYSDSPYFTIVCFPARVPRDLIALRAAHPALSSADHSLVDSGNPTVYGALRHANSDMILVLVNLGEQAITDYSIKLTSSSAPRGEYALHPLMGDAVLSCLSIDEQGGISGTSSCGPLAQHGTYILQLHKP